jgi:hypothetical protein
MSVIVLKFKRCVNEIIKMGFHIVERLANQINTAMKISSKLAAIQRFMHRKFSIFNSIYRKL